MKFNYILSIVKFMRVSVRCQRYGICVEYGWIFHESAMNHDRNQAFLNGQNLIVIFGAPFIIRKMTLISNKWALQISHHNRS